MCYQWLKWIVLVGTALVVTSNVQAKTLSFDGMSNQYLSTASSFGVNDFTFGYTPGVDGFAAIGNASVCSVGCASNGHNAFYSFNSGVLSFDETRGGAFRLTNFDAAQTFTGGNRALDILVTGTLRNGGTVTQEFREANGAADVFHTFALSSGFTNLSSVKIAGLGAYPAGEFAVNGFQVSAVPEPQTYALMAAGLSTLLFMARRRRMK